MVARAIRLPAVTGITAELGWSLDCWLGHTGALVDEVIGLNGEHGLTVETTPVAEAWAWIDEARLLG